MTHLNRLSSLLLRLGLSKEAAELMHLAPPPEMSEEDMAEAAKEFGSDTISEEEYLESIVIEPKISKHDLHHVDELADEKMMATFEILKQNGIQPLVAGKKNILGTGSFGVVIRGVYSGKPVVVKISFSGDKDNYFYQELSNDVANWKRILALRPSMPPEIKKHIPEIYLLNKGVIVHNGIPDDYQIVVMEELKKLPRNLLSAVYDNVGGISNNEILRRFLINLNNELFKTYGLNPIPVARVVKAIIMNSPSMEPALIQKEVIDWINNENRQINNDFKLINKVKETISSLIANDKYLDDRGVKDFDGSAIPARATEDSGLLNPVEEIEWFYKTLLWLADHGVNWADMKPDNIMVGSDGNMKIVDVGAFI